MLLAGLQRWIVPGSRCLSAVERRLHLHRRLLLGAELQRAGRKHDWNLPAKQLSRRWPAVLDEYCLLLWLVLCQLEPDCLHHARSTLPLRDSAELDGPEKRSREATTARPQ